MAPFRYGLRVRFHECDPQGIVFNAHFLAYADIAVTELYREAFGSWDAPMTDHDVDMVVAEANVVYRSPLRFDDEFELVVTMPTLGTTSTVTRVEIVHDGETAAEVELRHVFVEPQQRTKTPMPDAVRAALERYA